jgi:hypothetical protein
MSSRPASLDSFVHTGGNNRIAKGALWILSGPTPLSIGECTACIGASVLSEAWRLEEQAHRCPRICGFALQGREGREGREIGGACAALGVLYRRRHCGDLGNATISETS